MSKTGERGASPQPPAGPKAAKKTKRRPVKRVTATDDDDRARHPARIQGKRSTASTKRRPQSSSSSWRRSTRGRFEAPDAAEVMEMSQTRNLYKSNLFRMQLEALLEDVKPKTTTPPKRLENVLRALQKALVALTPRELPSDLGQEFPNIMLFNPQHPFPFPFKPPTRVDIVGSFLLGTYLRTSEVVKVDLALEMPAEGFKSKDYLNFRYWDQRAAYCAEVCKQLAAVCAQPPEGAETLLGLKVELAAMQGDVWRPCVEIRLPREYNSRFIIRLLPTYPESLWSASKLSPDRNAVRPGAGVSTTPSEEPAQANQQSFPPTPHYNSCVLEDCRMRSHLEFVHQALRKVSQLQDAILLLRHWAVAQSFISLNESSISAYSALTGFCLTILAVHVSLTSSVVSSQTSSFQIFKLALALLSSTDWDTQKVILGKAALATLTPLERGLCKAHFYDQDGVLNFFWRVGPFMNELKQVSKETLRVLDAQEDSYESVFSSSRGSLELRWDLVVRLERMDSNSLCPGLCTARGCETTETERFIDVPATDCPSAAALGQRIAGVLTAGLGNRCVASGVRFLQLPTQRWVKEPPKHGPSVVVCLALDAGNLDLTVDKGPSVEDPEAVERFQALWGNKKTEMRRFKDGSILECVAWTRPPGDRSAESAKRPAVVTQVIRHLLARHFSKYAANATIVAGPAGLVPSLQDKGRLLWASFEAFRTHLCQLSSLPLTIKDVHPAAAGLSYTETIPSMAPATPDGIERPLYETVVEFESSARWPSEREAQQKVCLAMLLQMQEELGSDLGIESGISEAGFLDVRYPNVTFRVRVFHAHELIDVAHRVTNIQAEAQGPPERERVDKLRRVWWRPRLCAAMRAQVLQQPALAGAVTLAKRWMASQMLSGFEDCVEHLVASVFLQPTRSQAPTSPQVGFSRFCRLVAEHPWSDEPLIVDFDGKLTAADKEKIQKSFVNFKSKQTVAEDRMPFWISSRFDPHAMLLEVPPATASAWLRGRAQEALLTYRECMLGIPASPSSSSSLPKGPPDWSRLYAVNTDGFDVVLQLAARGSEGSGQQASKKAAAKLAQQRQVAGRTAAQALVERLTSHLSSVCLIFHDLEGCFIALKWRPGAFLPQPTSTLMGAVPHTAIPATQDGRPTLCVPNVLCLMSIITSLSADLAVNMTVQGI